MLYLIGIGTIGVIIVKKLTIALASLACFLTGSVAGSADLLPGQQSFHNVTELTTQIHWYTGLAQAEYEAQRDGKLVLWLHMLGDLTGAT